MAEVKIIITAEDGTTQTFRAVEQKGKSAVDGIKDATQRASVNVQSSLDGVEKAVRRVVAAVAAWKLADQVKDSALLAARVETLGVVMEQVGKNALYSRSELDSYVESIKKMGITTQEAEQTVVRMIQAHLDLSKATDLARVAQDAAVIANTNSSEALQGLMNGITTLQPEILRTYGIIVDFESEYGRYAASIGRTVDALSGQEKQQIALNAALKAGEGIAGSYEAAMGTVGKQLTSLPRLIEETKLQFGELFKPALTVLVQEFSKELKDVEAYFSEAAASGKMEEWGKNIAHGVKDSVETVVSLAKAISDNKDAIKSLADTAVELLIFGVIADKALKAAKSIDMVTAAAKRFLPILASYAVYKGWEAMSEWADGTYKVRKETEELAATLARQKKALAEAEAAVKAQSAAEEEANKKFQAELREAVKAQVAKEAEQERKHGDTLKRQAEQDKEYLKKWEAMKETIGLSVEEQSQKTLDKEYSAFQRVALDKVQLEQWYAGKKTEMARAAALEVAEADRKALEERLATAQRFYGSVGQMIRDNYAEEKKLIDELNALYKQRADIQTGTASLIRGLQEIGMSPGQKYESQKSALAAQFSAAMQQSGQEQVSALEEYKQALASFGQAWSSGVAETSRNMLFGEQTSVIVAGKDVISSVITDIETATALQKRALDSLAEEKQQEIEANEKWGATLVQTAQEWGAEITMLQETVSALSGQIDAMQKTVTISGDDQVSWVVDNIAQALAELHDKTIYITTVYRSVTEGGEIVPSSGGEAVSSSGEAGTPPHSGTYYIPKTGLYRLLQGESVRNPRETAQDSGRNGASISISLPSITVVAREGDDPRALAREIVKPLQDEMRRLKSLA